MPPPMSALIVAKDSNNDLVEVVLFEKFNDLRGFGRRLFLSMEQLVNCGTTRLEIEVVLGRQSPSFSLRLLRRMMTIAKEADERMRYVSSNLFDLIFTYSQSFMTISRVIIYLSHIRFEFFFFASYQFFNRLVKILGFVWHCIFRTPAPSKCLN